MFLELTGTGGASTNLIVPANKKLYFIYNNSTGAVTVKVSGLTGVAVPAGKRLVVYNNGTDVSVQTDYLPSLSLGTALPATEGGTGQSSFAVGDTFYASTTTAISKLGIGTTNQVLTVVAGVPAWVSPTAASYPGAGIANSTGSAWGTSYSVSGTGDVVLTTGATLVTPALGTPVSGILSGCTVDGTNAVGFRNIPQNAQTGSYTMVLADSGKHIYHASGAGAATYTIPAASSVAYPIGTAITFVNLSTTSVSIAITTDTMYLSSAGTTGTRTLAQYGSATAIKVSGLSSSGIWVISGSGLT
jgi:hypothetical protein